MIPQLRVWHNKYQGSGLTIVGIHTPEFFWEKSFDRVAAAVKDLGIQYPVVQDNDNRNWNRFGVWAWPTTILVDRKGVVRYQHIGEGAYAETESMIRRLLAEKN